ncbi:MAG: hypothetical protein N3I35_11105 [Clostridia bacterium]|nr:hypothetical protein [Clostridia bacterium]
MIQNFRGKYIKDIETASDTIMHNSDFTSSIRHKDKSNNSLGVIFQQVGSDTFDNYIEKKNKELK